LLLRESLPALAKLGGIIVVDEFFERLLLLLAISKLFSIWIRFVLRWLSTIAWCEGLTRSTRGHGIFSLELSSCAERILRLRFRCRWRDGYAIGVVEVVVTGLSSEVDVVELFIQSVIVLVLDVLHHEVRQLESFLAELAAVLATLLDYFGLVEAVLFLHRLEEFILQGIDKCFSWSVFDDLPCSLYVIGLELLG